MTSRLTAVRGETKSVRSDSRHCGFSVGEGCELTAVCPPAPGWLDCPEASPVTGAGLGLQTLPLSHFCTLNVSVPVASGLTPVCPPRTPGPNWAPLDPGGHPQPVLGSCLSSLGVLRGAVSGCSEAPWSLGSVSHIYAIAAEVGGCQGQRWGLLMNLAGVLGSVWGGGGQGPHTTANSFPEGCLRTSHPEPQF